ncbi:hypothetical protein BRD18_05115 [Halobacteriales archaeon SW_7_71_33]|nr:MAG: hypothetical protein BRD18_05115 [Halobacteriales archaeon SW_7_71_33]
MEYGLVVVWLLAYVALGALALPAAALLLRPFPDRGAGFALPVALAVLGVVGFWVGQVAFGWPALAAGLLALVGVAVLSLWRGASPDPRRYAEVTAVFAVAFLFLVAVRALDPAVHPGGGEKFLDFGMLSALARTSQLPPEDFWFAGEPVQYYYGGHMLAALLARLTGTAPRYAYNLALAGFYATFVAAAYSLAGAVAHHRGRSRVSAGLFAAFLVGVASNLATPLRALAWWVGDGTVLRLAGLDPEWATTGPEAFSYWPASRVISWTVNEFPLFAFLNGDLHAHMMSPPLTLLVAAVGYAYWRTPAADLRRRRLLVGAVAPTAGLVAVVNTWSFPATLGLVWLALALAPADPRDLLPESLRTGCAVGLAGVVGGLAAVAALPFLAGTGATGGRGLTFVAPADRSRVGRLLVVHGTTLALAAVFLGGRLRDGLRDRNAGETSRPAAVAAVAVAGLVAVVALVTLVLPAIVGVDPRVLGVTPFVALVAVGWVLLRAEADVGYETVLLVGAAGLVTLVEFVYVTRTGPGRFNTVFKLYSQVWALTAVGGGVLLAEYANPAGLLGLRDRSWLPAATTRTDGGSPSASPPETEFGSDDSRRRRARRARRGPGAGDARRAPLRRRAALGGVAGRRVRPRTGGDPDDRHRARGGHLPLVDRPLGAHGAESGEPRDRRRGRSGQPLGCPHARRLGPRDRLPGRDRLVRPRRDRRRRLRRHARPTGTPAGRTRRRVRLRRAGRAPALRRVDARARRATHRRRRRARVPRLGARHAVPGRPVDAGRRGRRSRERRRRR